jgi:hypothetical protein
MPRCVCCRCSCPETALSYTVKKLQSASLTHRPAARLASVADSFHMSSRHGSTIGTKRTRRWWHRLLRQSRGCSDSPRELDTIPDELEPEDCVSDTTVGNGIHTMAASSSFGWSTSQVCLKASLTCFDATLLYGGSCSECIVHASHHRHLYYAGGLSLLPCSLACAGGYAGATHPTRCADCMQQ